ncbi:23073_t:CDS:1, partial [Racocetra persica]
SNTNEISKDTYSNKEFDGLNDEDTKNNISIALKNLIKKH